MLASSVFSKSAFQTFFPHRFFFPVSPLIARSIKGIALGPVELNQSFLTVSYRDSVESFTVSKALSWNTGLGREVNE